jgi:hypothetical protein
VTGIFLKKTFSEAGLLWFFLLLFLDPPRAAAQCLERHGDRSLTTKGPGGRVLSLYIDAKVFHSSVHGSLDCRDCHAGITDLPHPADLPEVVCGNCHTGAAQAYQWHGARREMPGHLMPGCFDCHGKHDILAPDNKASTVNPLNLPHTCGRCHEDPNIVGQYHIPMIRPVQVYEASVHYRVAPGSASLAATCVDCHSYGGTGREIMAPLDPQSSIYHFNIPRTCGRCHREIEKEYAEGVHGLVAAKGEADTTVCTNCHSDHQILSPDDPNSPVNPTRVSNYDMCSLPRVGDPEREVWPASERDHFLAAQLSWFEEYRWRPDRRQLLIVPSGAPYSARD